MPFVLFIRFSMLKFHMEIDCRESGAHEAMRRIKEAFADNNEAGQVLRVLVVGARSAKEIKAFALMTSCEVTTERDGQEYAITIKRGCMSC